MFQDETVTVTNVRAIVRQNTTYAMSNITSVREFMEPRPVAIVLGGFCLMGLGLFCVKVDIADSGQVGWFGSAIGLLMIVTFFFMKPKYWVRIGTAGAEANAIFSHDPGWTRRVVAAINSAIITRG